MINNSKTTENLAPAQVAGLAPTDNNSEFIGVTDTKKVLWLHQGKTTPWERIPKWVYRLCQNKYLSDASAMEILGKLPVSIDRQIELFIYYSYGAVDSKADILNGKLQPSENFRDSKKCVSLDFDSKEMTIDGVVLNNRDVFLIDCYKEDLPDKMIAHQLGISLSTLDFHKRNLMKKVGAQTKLGVLVKAINEKI